MGCRQCLPLSVVQLKGKHCWKPHCRNGVVDMFGLWFVQVTYLETDFTWEIWQFFFRNEFKPKMRSLAIKVRLYVIKITREHLIWEQYLSIKLEPICHYTEWYHKNWWFIFLHWKMSSTYYINVRFAKLYFDFYRISYLYSDFWREDWNLITCIHLHYIG